MPEPQQVEILLVEDNANDVELTLHALRQHNLANSIHVVRDGGEAIEFLHGDDDRDGACRPSPRVVLLDLKLPRVSGIEVLKTIKGDGRTSRLPVVVLTSSREDRDIDTCYDLGASSYIVKPVDFEQFTSAVAQVGLYWLLLNEPPGAC